MSEANERQLPGILGETRLRFVLKSAGILVILFVLSKTLPSMPPVCIGIIWALISGVVTIGFLYHVTVRKAARQLVLRTGGWLAWFNSGRMLALLISFAVSAVLVAGLVLETPKWKVAEWVLVVLAVPLYIGVSALVSRVLSGEYAPLVRVSKTTIVTSAVVGIVLCIAYAVIMALQPAVTYESLTQAFLSVEQPYSNSPSALMSEGGMLVALVDGATVFGMSETAKVSLTGYIIWKVVLIASAFFGISSLLGFCSLEWSELRRGFLRLGAKGDSNSEGPIVKRYVAMAVIMPICLAVAFAVVDAKVSDTVASEEYSAVKTYLRDKVGIAVCYYDGHMYEWASVQSLIDEAEAKFAALDKEAHETLAPLVNAYYDARLANVDGYLDWYYSLQADYERLARAAAGTAEEYMREQFATRIEEGVDDSELMSALENYYGQYEALRTEIGERFAKYQIDDVPSWLLVSEDPPDMSVITGGFTPSHKFLDDRTRFGISSAAGVGLGVGIDFGILKLDEFLNRESFKAEIVAAIEEERANTLAQLP